MQPAAVAVHCALAAVGHRHAVLALRRAEVGGGHGCGVVGKAAVDEHGGQGQRFAHGGAGAVKPVKGDVELPQAEGGADALVQQVACQNIVDVSGGQLGPFQRSLQHSLLHGGLGLLPAFFSEERVVVDLVKIAAQGPLSLHFAADVGPGEHRGGMVQPHGLAPQSFLRHGITSIL